MKKTLLAILIFLIAFMAYTWSTFSFRNFGLGKYNIDTPAIKNLQALTNKINDDTQQLADVLDLYNGEQLDSMIEIVDDLVQLRNYLRNIEYLFAVEKSHNMAKQYNNPALFVIQNYVKFGIRPEEETKNRNKRYNTADSLSKSPAEIKWRDKFRTYDKEAQNLFKKVYDELCAITKMEVPSKQPVINHKNI